ncbi:MULTISPECIES: CinA family nicotinamide mononucleotide deamidase-related protein [unclassified Meiothermus]|uniref:CinA family nicotinamide mononucleotide deamidase-related protein n=1 Tax=unclassified Meiothermus TaxID=370471 RepID=UPI000D7C40A0|nr:MULTISPECIES: CinA family nicotinamide mononucleotide deamidase-related protein [unclassified Meiothermus]PZA06684.1 damage-inducible protein CinA [Meiothermus sp. Pnk-1]RYM36610.1 CinA family nicotinamide mononucleotide deamidase-related protein [Meiothermus sp. PNK-Is4]
MFLAEIIGVGSELIYGDTLDTNTSDIAVSLLPYALEVKRTLRVADDVPELVASIRAAWDRSRLVVLSGGLGPTADDVTREAIAEALGEPLELDQAVLDAIEAFFKSRGRVMAEVNRKQAMKIPSAAWLANPRGTAPGWWVHKDGKDLVALPGPPAEWKPMWQELLPKLALPPAYYYQKTFKTFGIGESDIAQALGELFRREEGLEVGSYAKPWGVEVVIRGHSPAAPALAEAIRERLKNVWGEDDDSLPQVVLRGLEARRATLATAESLTGGMLGSLVTEVPGASRVYLGGLVSYSPLAKARFGVPGPVLEAHGTVSAQTARAMAEAVQGALGSTYALATTGVAGPEELEGKPVGTVHIGLAGPGETKVFSYHLPVVSRQTLRQRAAYTALGLLVRELG